MPSASKPFRKETLAEVISCEFCKLFTNTYFVEHLRVVAWHFLGYYKMAWMSVEPAFFCYFSADIQLLKSKNENIKRMCKIYLKLTIKTPEGQQWPHSVLFIVNFEEIIYTTLVFSLLTLIAFIPSIIYNISIDLHHFHN